MGCRCGYSVGSERRGLMVLEYGRSFSLTSRETRATPTVDGNLADSTKSGKDRYVDPFLRRHAQTPHSRIVTVQRCVRTLIQRFPYYSTLHHHRRSHSPSHHTPTSHLISEERYETSRWTRQHLWTRTTQLLSSSARRRLPAQSTIRLNRLLFNPLLAMHWSTSSPSSIRSA